MSKLNTVASAMRARAHSQPNRFVKHRLGRGLVLAVLYKDSHYYVTISRRHQPPSAHEAAAIKRAFGVPEPVGWSAFRQGRHHLWRISWPNGAAA